MVIVVVRNFICSALFSAAIKNKIKNKREDHSTETTGKPHLSGPWFSHFNSSDDGLPFRQIKSKVFPAYLAAKTFQENQF